ncbi:hypothetical protein ACFQ0P_08460 [Microbacterium insulae]|uniref:Uncharacterized protein n=1 Tax=Microbacterium insulae TaxID=483014 RepID=A0ABW3AHG0_9MICO
MLDVLTRSPARLKLTLLNPATTLAGIAPGLDGSLAGAEARA